MSGVEKFDVGDADGLLVVAFLELSKDEGFPDGTESRIIWVNEGISDPEGLEDGNAAPMDGLAVVGVEVVTPIGDADGATGKQSMHLNNTAQSWFELLGANPIVLIMSDCIEAIVPFWKSPPLRGSYHRIE